MAQRNFRPDVTHGFASQEVGGFRPVVVYAYCQAVVEEAGLQTYVEAACGFPLDGGVLDVGQFKTGGLVDEFAVFEIGTGSIVVYVVVTTLFITCYELEVVDAFDIKPFF